MEHRKLLISFVFLLLGLVALASGSHPSDRRAVFLHNAVLNTRNAESFNEHEAFQKLSRNAEEKGELQQYIVHVTHPATAAKKQEIENFIRDTLGDYLPHNSYLLVSDKATAERANQDSNVLWVGPYLPEYKISATLKNRVADEPDIRASLHDKVVPEDLSSIAAELSRSGKNSLGYEVGVVVLPANRLRITLRTNGNADLYIKGLQWLSEQSAIHFMEPILEAETQNKFINWVIQSDMPNQLPVWNANLNGSDEILGLGDTGIDWDNCFFYDGSPPPFDATDLTRRKIVRYFVENGGDQSDSDLGHGTAMAGTMIGQASTSDSTELDFNAQFNGVAFAGKIWFTDLSSNSSGTTITVPTDIQDYFYEPYKDGVNIHVDAFGTYTNDAGYSALAQDVDAFCSDFEDYLIVVAAGNYGDNGPTSLTDMALSKNALVVGSCYTDTEGLIFQQPANIQQQYTSNPSIFGTDALSTFSSRGPTLDGRYKPDLVAPGEYAWTASSDGITSSNQCGVLPASGAALAQATGTSISASAVGGAAAMVREYFTAGFYPDGARGTVNAQYVNPWSATLKAVLLHSGQPIHAVDLNGDGNYASIGQTLPDNYQGFGRFLLNSTLYFENTSPFGLFVVQDLPVTPEQTQRFCFTISPGTEMFKATLVWTDPSGSLTAGLALINNLDLAIARTDTGQMYRGNMATTFDAINNVEQITLLNPPAGNYAVYVYGTTVVTTQQNFALVVTGYPSLDQALCIEGIGCPQSCSLSGTCSAGICQCTNGRYGIDCSLNSCPQNCSSNGVCNPFDSSCTCADGWQGDDCSTPASATTGTVVIVNDGSSSGIAKPIFIGVVIAAFFIGAIIAGVLGMFLAVKFMEKKRKALLDKRKSGRG